MNDNLANSLRTHLAYLCHSQWSNWMEYLFSKGSQNDDGSFTLPGWAVLRWKRQMATRFNELSETEKESDYNQADKFLVDIFKYIELDNYNNSVQQKLSIKLDQENTEDEFVSFETVNHPAHYNQVPGIECIDVVRHFSFNRGNAIKYIWRAGYKGDEIEDFEKAIWYLQDEIERLKEERQRFIQESMDKSFEEHKDIWQELADK